MCQLLKHHVNESKELAKCVYFCFFILTYCITLIILPVVLTIAQPCPLFQTQELLSYCKYYFTTSKTTLCKQNHYGAVVTPPVLFRSQFSEMLTSSFCKHLSQEGATNPWDEIKEISMNTNKTQIIRYFICQHRTLKNFTLVSKNTGYATVKIADFSA